MHSRDDGSTRIAGKSREATKPHPVSLVNSRALFSTLHRSDELEKQKLGKK